LTAVSPADDSLGQYFLIDVVLPHEIDGSVELTDAYIELHMDLTTSIDSELLANMAKVEIYPLSGSASGEITMDDVGRVLRRRLVPVGSNRVVRLDILRYVQNIIANPEENNGLVVGSLRGSRNGHFTVRQGEIAAGVYAKITYVYR